MMNAETELHPEAHVGLNRKCGLYPGHQRHGDISNCRICYYPTLRQMPDRGLFSG